MNNLGLNLVLVLQKRSEVIKNRSTPVTSLIGIFLITLLLVGVVSAAGDAVMYRFDARRTGDYSSVAGSTLPTNQPIWRFQTDNYGSSPTVADGVVYIGTYAIRASTGDLLWRLPSGGLGSSAAVADGVVYSQDWGGYLNAIDIATQNRLWRFPTGAGGGASPAVVDGVVYAGGRDSYVYAIDADTGNLIWKFKTGGMVFSSPAVADGVVYAAGYGGGVFAINATTGDQLWHFPTGTIVDSSPAVANGVVYIGCYYDGNLYALDAETGEQVWKFQTGGSIDSSPAVADGVVYIGSYDGNLYAIDTDTGIQKWIFPLRGFVVSSPSIANGIVYIGSMYGDFYAIDTDTGNQLWKFKTGAGIVSSAAVANGIVYFGSRDGNVFAIGGNGNVNRAPVLDPIGPQSIDAGKLLTFMVSGSDPDNDALTYSTGTLPAGAAFDTGTKTFTWTPSFSQAGTYIVTFTVSDGTLTDTEAVTITVNNVNRAPVLDTIGAKSTEENKQLQFSVSGSDPDGTPVTFSATNLPSGAQFSGSTFIWTSGFDQAGTYKVIFTVSDGALIDTEDVTITVNNVNRPPDTSGAYPSIGCLWPPNNKYVGTTIQGVTDPDGDPVMLTITKITSDEATASEKDSGGVKHAPDAIIGSENAFQLRSERSGDGNGRVYMISFAASDGKGGVSNGAVTVCVPHDQSQTCSCIDDGQKYDATTIS